MSKYNEYKRSHFIVNALQEYLCGTGGNVQTFRLHDIELTLDKESGKFSIYTPETGRVEFSDGDIKPI